MKAYVILPIALWISLPEWLSFHLITHSNTKGKCSPDLIFSECIPFCMNFRSIFFFLFMSVMQERNTGCAAWLQFSQEYDLSSAVHLSRQILDFLHSSSSRFRVLRRLFFWLPPSFRCARFISRLPAASVVRLIITAGKKGSAELLSVEWPIDYITDEKLRRGWRCGTAGSDAASGSCLPVWSFSWFSHGRKGFLSLLASLISSYTMCVSECIHFVGFVMDCFSFFLFTGFLILWWL